jgi:hypothetical protein
MKKAICSLLLLAFAGLSAFIASAAGLSAGLVVYVPPTLLWQVQAPKSPAYPFDRFPAGNVYKGHPAAPKLVTAEQREFRTVLRNGAKKGPNFAGHFHGRGMGLRF